MNVDEIVDEIRAGAGIDLDNAATRVPRWVRHLVRELAADSEWIKAEPNLGPTVVGQALYTIPSNVVRITDLSVGETPYEREGLRTIRDLRAGRVYASSGEGYFSEAFSADGLTKQVRLDPAPDVAGSAITALAVLYPGVLAGADELPFPDEYHYPHVHGGIAIGLRLGDETHTEADRHQAIWEAAKAKLRTLGKRRLRSTNNQAKIVGVHF